MRSDNLILANSIAIVFEAMLGVLVPLGHAFARISILPAWVVFHSEKY